MKFYYKKYNHKFNDYWNNISSYISLNKLTAICQDYDEDEITFYYDGKINNNKSAANINHYYGKGFWINDEFYGNSTHFTKQSWRKFVRELKLQAFL